MSLLNQKEDVISVELTKHGRKLLGMGILKPYYFSFFDDNIMYDNLYAGVSEEVNSIENRILDNTLSLTCLNTLEDVLSNPLGSSKTTSDYAPAWSLKVINGKIEIVESQSSYYKKIFNIENITYKLSMVEDTYISKKAILESDYFLIDLDELNVDEDMENFEIELIAYDEVYGGKTVGLERKLLFEQKNNNIIDDIIYEENELPSKFYESNFNAADATYYYDVLVDDEIDTEFITVSKKGANEIVPGVYKSTYIGPVKDPKC